MLVNKIQAAKQRFLLDLDSKIESVRSDEINTEIHYDCCQDLGRFVMGRGTLGRR